MHTKTYRILTALTLPMLVLMGLVSWIGFMNEDTYARELPSFAAQGAGQDFVNLFIGAPVMLISLLWMRKGSKTASWIFAGLALYYMYSYIIYVFGLRYNGFFLAYCFILALSTYILVFWIHFNARQDISEWFKQIPPVGLTGGFMLFITILFYLLWLKDLVPPLIEGKAPPMVMENDYIINPVHAIDLSFMLPGLIIVSILLFRKHPLGLLLTPVVLVFIITLTIALAAMILVVFSRGIEESAGLVYVFAALAVVSGIILMLFLRSLKRPGRPADHL
jgi:hypothetical protein